jgi:hypothetical protein
MGKRVAVSESLSPVKRALHRAGYDVVNLESDAEISKKGMGDYDAIILSGMDDNLMGMQDISGRAPVINASGKEPDQILDELDKKFR